MDISAVEATPPPLQPPPPLSSFPSLEAVEIELELGLKKIEGEEYEAAIRETVEEVGGVLLFQMKADKDGAEHWMAAVAFETADGREIAIIDLPSSGQGVSVTPVSQSELPIATIAQAYAGLAENWTPPTNEAGPTSMAM